MSLLQSYVIGVPMAPTPPAIGVIDTFLWLFLTGSKVVQVAATPIP